MNYTFLEKTTEVVIKYFSAVITLVALTILQAQPSLAGERARPIDRSAPEYPEACESEAGNNDAQQYVDVAYDITSEGNTENVRVLYSTNKCFDDAAMAAVREWRFEPSVVGGQAAPQLGNKIRLAFVLDEKPSREIEAMLQEISAKIYPKRCERDAEAVEYVTLQYDISKEGWTKNVEVVESTNSCFNKSAIGAVEQWRYEPRIVDGQAVERINVEVRLTFRLE